MSEADNNAGYGRFNPFDGSSQFNVISFMIRQLLNQMNTVAVVQVLGTSNAGEVAEVGTVDVRILVNLTDGNQQSFPHDIIYKVPVFRLQGGNNAIIIDPEVGDIGLAAFADHDISSVIANKSDIIDNQTTVNPGSQRRFDFADALYFGGFLNVVPLQYLRFRIDGVELVDLNNNKITTTPNGITLQDTNGNSIDMGPSGIVIVGDVHTNGALFNNGVDVGSTHVHSGVTSGGSDTGPPI